MCLSLRNKSLFQDEGGFCSYGEYMAGETEVRYLPFGSELVLTVKANELGKPLLADMVTRKH